MENEKQENKLDQVSEGQGPGSAGLDLGSLAQTSTDLRDSLLSMSGGKVSLPDFELFNKDKGSITRNEQAKDFGPKDHAQGSATRVEPPKDFGPKDYGKDFGPKDLDKGKDPFGPKDLDKGKDPFGPKDLDKEKSHGNNFGPSAPGLKDMINYDEVKKGPDGKEGDKKDPYDKGDDYKWGGKDEFEKVDPDKKREIMDKLDPEGVEKKDKEDPECVEKMDKEDPEGVEKKDKEDPEGVEKMDKMDPEKKMYENELLDKDEYARKMDELAGKYGDKFKEADLKDKYGDKFDPKNEKFGPKFDPKWEPKFEPKFDKFGKAWGKDLAELNKKK